MTGKQQEHIDSLVKKLVSAYKPEKIILFGSVARGTQDKNSDIDLLIIKKDIPERGIDRMREVRMCIKPQTAVDFLVYKPDEVAMLIKAGDLFLQSVFKEGKYLYG